jgi:serine/threonine-protein kinase RsbW
MANPRRRKAPETGEKIVIQIPAHPRWVRTVRLAAAGVASGLNFSVEDIEDIKLAIAEACNNAILHAQSPDKNRMPMVTVTFVPSPDRLEISV